MKIQIEYPLIFGNDLCDGTWHDATVEELYLVDDDIVILNDELMADLDKDLDDFLGKLLKE
jgi:hypothetical protein